jgi:hypothetical protein
MTYKDMTFCKAWKECKKGNKCERAYTEKLIVDATIWWGGPNAPIAVTDKFDCFELKEEKDE